MLPSDLQTTSFGRDRRLPLNLSISTSLDANVPSAGQRVTRRLPPSHWISRPCRSKVVPLPSPVFSRSSSAFSPGLNAIEFRLPYIDEIIEPVRMIERPFGEGETGIEPLRVTIDQVVERGHVDLLWSVLQACHLAQSAVSGASLSL